MREGLTRRERLAEAADAAVKLREVGALGDRRRYDDDDVFRYAVAFLWLRFTEPLCQLVSRRQVGDATRRGWAGMCDIRNALAHERSQDIDFKGLWEDIPSTLDRNENVLDRLLASG